MWQRWQKAAKFIDQAQIGEGSQRRGSFTCSMPCHPSRRGISMPSLAGGEGRQRGWSGVTSGDDRGAGAGFQPLQTKAPVVG